MPGAKAPVREAGRTAVERPASVRLLHPTPGEAESLGMEDADVDHRNGARPGSGECPSQSVPCCRSGAHQIGIAGTRRRGEDSQQLRPRRFLMKWMKRRQARTHVRMQSGRGGFAPKEVTYGCSLRALHLKPLLMVRGTHLHRK